MTISIYKNNDYKVTLLRLYDKYADLLPGPKEEGYVETSFGRTHYLIIGSRDLPVLIHFHGGNSINPQSLLPIADLSARYRIIAPDIVGPQPEVGACGCPSSIYG